MMSIHRIRFLCCLCLVAGAMLLGASTARAQVRIPTENTLDDLQLFAPVESNAMSDRPYLKEGLFFTHDFLVWSVQKPRVALIGYPGETRLVFNQTTFEVQQEVNTINTSYYKDLLETGNRTEFGYMDDCHGWMVGVSRLHQRSQTLTMSNAPVLFRDPQNLVPRTFLPLNVTFQNPITGVTQTRQIDADIDGDRVYGRFGEDLGTLVIIGLPPGAPQGPRAPHPDVTQPAFDGGTGGGRPLHPAGSLGNGFNSGFYLPYDGNPDSLVNGSRPDLDDLVQSPIDFDDIVATNRTEIFGVEGMYMRRLDRISFGGHWELAAGVRHISFKEQFYLQGDGGILVNTVINNEAENMLVGPQIMARWFRSCDRSTFAAEGRLAPSVNFQAVRMNSTIGDSPNSSLTFHNSSNDSLHAYEFSPVAELRLNWSYQCTRAIAVRAGYTALYVGGLARPSHMVEYLIPAPRILNDENIDDCFMQGINLGVEINR